MRAALTFSFTLFLFVHSIAQDKLNTVQQAMRDELERNMKEMKSEGFDRPFFINYTIQDITLYHISATLGALTQSQESKGRSALSIRMLVGDYDFNDESLDNNLYSPPQANAISLPIDDDYLGIRRSLWISTDNVYRNASRQFAKNKEMVKEQEKPLAELPHRTFAKVPPSKIDIEGPAASFDKAATEEYVRKVSAIFKDFKEIDRSQVDLTYGFGYRYLVNSEGAVNRVPVNVLRMVVACSVYSPAGDIVYDNFTRYSILPELPPLDKTIGDAKSLAKNLIQHVTAPSLDEDYQGPVLFEGREAASMLYLGMFMTETSLFATNDIPRLKGSRYDPNPAGSNDQKMGKQVFAKGMTVKAIPKTKSFGDLVLFGSFEVDSEGTVPADETVLVEKGILKQLCNDRTITKPDQVANGLADGPGVLSVSFEGGVPLSTMKAKLIEQAKKEGLDYALRVSPSPGETYMGSIYKVYVSDGREELVARQSMGSLSQRAFKKILDTSNEVMACNLGGGEAVTSIICPQAVLFEEIEYTASHKGRSEKEEEYVPSPLKK
jgi:hypothetical protein